MKETSRMERKMAKALLFGLTGQNISVHGEMINNMASAFIVRAT